MVLLLVEPSNAPRSLSAPPVLRCTLAYVAHGTPAGGTPVLVILFSLSELSAKEMLLTGVSIAFVLQLDDLAGGLIMSEDDKATINARYAEFQKARTHDSSVLIGHVSAVASFVLHCVGFLVGQMVTCKDLDADLLYYRITVSGVWFTAWCEALVMAYLRVFRDHSKLSRRLLIFIMQTIAAAFFAVLLVLWLDMMRYSLPTRVYFLEWVPEAVWPPGPWLGIPLFQDVCPSIGFNQCAEPDWLWRADWFSPSAFWERAWISPPPSSPPTPEPPPPPPWSPLPASPPPPSPWPPLP
jgi:hypothetical protein